MKCPICRAGQTKPGTATLTLERNGSTIVVKGVPAQICDNCGEEYIDESAVARVLEAAEKDLRAGVKLEVREYVAA